MSEHLLILPRLRVQNANCISSPLTWGFPAITAFTGFMVALQRRLGPNSGLQLESVGVICHGFEAQVTHGGYTRSFHLTRNPVLQDGSTAAIVEEGRAHLDITLVFTVQTAAAYLDEEQRQSLAQSAAAQASGMRIAGGSVMPALSPGRARKPSMVKLSADVEERSKQFRRLRRQLLPGFALISRDDLLHKRLQALRADASPEATPPTLLDAWLDLSRINHRVTKPDVNGQVKWQHDARPGWLVPMPVGYAALSELHAAGTVANARDRQTPFRFVESVYSIGQWISPHRLEDASHFMWQPTYDAQTGLYRCANAYPAPTEEEIDLDSESLSQTEPQFD